MNESVKQQVQKVKRKTADAIDNLANKKQRKAQPKPKLKQKSKAKLKRGQIIVTPKQDYFDQ